MLKTVGKNSIFFEKYQNSNLLRLIYSLPNTKYKNNYIAKQTI